MSGPRQLTRTTRDFSTFFGLRLVPVGMWFVIVGLMTDLMGRPPTGVQILLLVIAIAAVWPIHRWYRREYGVVEASRLAFGRNWVLLVGAAVAAAALGLGAQRVGGSERLVLMVVLVFFAMAVLFVVPRAFGGSAVGTAVVLLSVLLVGAAMLVVAGRTATGFNSLGGLFSVAVGAALCVAGAVEHAFMRRAMQRLGSGRDV